MKLRALIVSTGVAAFALTGTVRADEPTHTPQSKPYPSKEESIGMVGGAGIGALAGGPFGFVIGMALGEWIGDRMTTQKRDKAQLAKELAEEKRKSEALNAKLESSDRAVEALSLELKASRERFAQLNEKS